MIEADDIMEPPAYLDSFKYDNLEDMEKALRKCFTIPFFVAFENLITATTHTIYFVTKPENFDIIRKKNAAAPRRHRTGSLGTGKETIRERR